ncbi:hypothetical protein NQ314_011566 [Rhamnusium bicolor]|uniref:Uncharacterized protein n=1 Tax=Rhamnusium bicolor TaxID=1586634 RepID=A0AAV8XI05_9CUCU|nr:hypothetical protein NQ314_011566 [Rhamnusium bicolor]
MDNKRKLGASITLTRKRAVKKRWRKGNSVLPEHSRLEEDLTFQSETLAEFSSEKENDLEISDIQNEDIMGNNSSDESDEYLIEPDIPESTLFAISDGMTYGWTAPYIPYLVSEESHIKTTIYEAEWLETALLLGSFSGLPITIYLVDKIGRKRSLLLASFVVTLAWIAIAFGDRIEYIFVARYFCGMSGNMAFVAAPMYNKSEEAKKSLEYFHPHADINKQMKEISDTIERQENEKGRIQDLVIVDSNRRAILIMTVLNAGQHLCAYTVILMNLHLILEAAGSIYIESSIAAILFAAIMLIAASVASFQIDKYGRKMLLIFSSVLTGICLLAMAIYFHLKTLNYDVLSVSWIPIVSVMVYAAVFKLGVGIVPIVITAEIFPTKLKAIGMTMADAMFIVGETKGKSLDQIQQMLKGGRPDSIII